MSRYSQVANLWPGHGRQQAEKLAALLVEHGAEIRANHEFNKTVNTRQVRRHYARVMEKRVVSETRAAFAKKCAEQRLARRAA